VSGAVAINVFEYSDYRAYLKDFYRQKKLKNPQFSYRSFALRAKITSPNYLKLVIDGQRRITDKYLNNFIRGLGLEKLEIEYFKNLVSYTDCDSSADDKKHYLDQIIKLRSRTQKQASQVDGTMTEFLKHWYICVVRELTLLADFQDDPKWVAQRMGNRITTKQAKEALDCLKKLQIIQLGEAGYKPSEALLTTGDESEHKLIVRRLHYQFASLSMASILNTIPEDRETSGLTIAISKRRLPAVKNLIRDFRQNLNKVLTTEDGNDEVYHLALNFFPLSGGNKQ